jgi:hypothetical protein
MGEITIKSKLAAKDCGDPKKILGLDADIKTLMLGTLIGQATKISQRADATGTKVVEGLNGTFEAIPADPKSDTIRSGTCYLPEGIFEMVAAPLRPDSEGKQAAESVRFAVEVSVVRATNPQGYSWSFKPLMNEAENENDPLVQIKAAMSKNGKALPAPAKEPSKETVKAK